MEQEELYQQASDEVFEEMMAQKKSQQAGQDAEYLKSMTEQHPQYGTKIGRFSTAVGTGAAKAVLETKDFIFGEPEEADKSQGRKNIESMSRALSNESMAYSLAGGVSQFSVGMLGAGKLLAPIKAVDNLKKGGKAARAVYETGRGALAASVVIDPHEERLSDLIQSYPSLENPLTEYLASNPEDSAAEGRLKNALEGIGMDVTLVGTFALSVKALKYFKAGDEEKALKALADSEAAEARNREAYSMDFTGNPNSAIQAKAAEINGDGLNKLSMPQAEGQAGLEVPNAHSVPEVKPEVPASPEATPQPEVPASSPDAKIEQVGSTPLSAFPEAPPTVYRTADIGEDDLQTLIKESASDADAIKQYGSREEAAASGYKFGKGGSLPWQKLRSSDESDAFVARVTETFKARYDTMKGGAILQDSKVSSLVSDIARDYNLDPAEVIGTLAKSGSEAAGSVAKMEASLLIGTKMVRDAEDVALQIKNGDLSQFGGDIRLAQEEMKARLTAGMDVQAAGLSILSNAGRSLRRARSEFRFTPDQIANIRSIPSDRLTDLVILAKGDAKKLAQLANPNFVKKVTNEAVWGLTNGLLWLWPTHTVNLASNTYMMLARPTEKLLGSAAMMLKPGVRSDPVKHAEYRAISRQAMKEYVYTATSISEGWHNAVEAFKLGDSRLSPQNTEWFQSGQTQIQTPALHEILKPVNDVQDVMSNVVNVYRAIFGLPTRGLGAQDEFFKTMRYRAVVQSKASVEGSEKGLSGQQLKDYIQSKLDEAIDPSTGQALDRAVLIESQKTTFQQELLPGTLGATIRNNRAAHPWMGLVLPFVKTPVNVLRYSMKHMPGLNLLQEEYRHAIQGKAGSEAQLHAYGQMALGSTFAFLGIQMAANDMVTGAGPSDLKLKQEMMAHGWKPYSIKRVAEDGSITYIPMGRLDPVGLVMSIAADLSDAMKADPENKGLGDAVAAFSISLAKNIGEKSFLLNLNQAIQAMADPDEKGGKYLGQMVGNLAPASSLMRGANPDPHLRDARNFTDHIMRNIPGFSDSLPPSRDVYGDPILRRVELASQWDYDLVEAEHNRIITEVGKGIGKIVPARGSGVDLRDLTLESGQNAYDRLQELGGQLPGAPSLKSMLATIIKSPAYQVLPDGDAETKGTRLWMLAGKVSDYRTLAWKKLRAESPLVRDALQKRQAETRDALQKNMREKAAQPSGAQSLLKALSPN